MSRQDVEVVRRAYNEFLEHGTLPYELCDPAIEIYNIPQSPIPGPYFGQEGLRRWWSDVTDVIAGARLRLEHIVDLDDGKILGRVRFSGRVSGGELIDELPSPPWFVVHWVRDGLVVRTAGYSTKAEALQAVRE
jgi:hypothetical protein